MSAHAHNVGGHEHSAGAAHAHGELQMGHHHISTPQLFRNVLITLLVLTAITVAASRINFGSANMLIAMAIASIKASLVIAFFMHLRWDTGINKIVFLSSFLFLSLLFIFTLGDQATRRMDHEMHVVKAGVDKQWVQPLPLHAGKQ
ncbi:MAG TPA: cytochrome C oxidase subunit IV family protein [Planctomycetota bacterium]|nr:cytochrome C oxidase subunit IV family protein [Planctomycetota bacterium]